VSQCLGLDKEDKLGQRAAPGNGAAFETALTIADNEASNLGYEPVGLHDDSCAGDEWGCMGTSFWLRRCEAGRCVYQEDVHGHRLFERPRF
jgi:hypothetical protein